MDLYNIAKDILVPLVSPLIAALALALVVKQERAKLSAQRAHKLEASVTAAERELVMLREAYQLIGLYLKQRTPPGPERLASFDESADRLLKTFNDNPEAYDAFFSKRKRGLLMPKMPLLFSELQIKLKKVQKATKVDNFILFSIYLLLYARAEDREDAEPRTIINSIYETDPRLYSAWWDTRA